MKLWDFSLDISHDVETDDAYEQWYDFVWRQL